MKADNVKTNENGLTAEITGNGDTSIEIPLDNLSREQIALLKAGKFSVQIVTEDQMN